MSLKFKVTWTPHTIMIEEKNQILKKSPTGLFLVSVAQMLFSLHQFHTWEKFLTFSSQWNLLTRTTCHISSHSLMWGKGFLTFPQPIFNFLTFCMCGIGYNEFPHIFPHTRPSWKIKRKIPYIFPMCGISANALFLTSIPHMRKIPHIFLTFSSHWNFIVYVQWALSCIQRYDINESAGCCCCCCCCCCYCCCCCCCSWCYCCFCCSCCCCCIGKPNRPIMA